MWYYIGVAGLMYIAANIAVTSLFFYLAHYAPINGEKGKRYE